MLGDILLIEEKHRIAGAAIVREAIQRGTEKLVIGISGESGAGKSELGHVVARGLRQEGVLAKCYSTDNFYRIHPLERRAWREEHGIEEVVGYDEYDWDQINQLIDDFKNGRESSVPCVDLVTEQIDILRTDLSRVKVLVLDGLYSIKTEGVGLKVFIELTYHETKKAQTVRGKETANEVRMRTLEQEHKMVQALRPSADLLVTKQFEVVPRD